MPDRNKAVKLHVEARAELQESIAFYRERAGEAWAARYKQRVAEGLKAIGANPERYPPALDLPGVQKLRIEQFPFSCFTLTDPITFGWLRLLTQAASRVTGKTGFHKKTEGTVRETRCQR